MRATRLRSPSSAFRVPRMLTTTVRAAACPCSRLRSAPTLPVWAACPSTKGPWPETKSRDPTRTVLA